MAYDDVILRMGEFGRYQRRVYLLLCLPAISCAFHKLAGVFLGAKMSSRCLLPHEHAENATYHLSQDMLNASYPWDYELRGWSQCMSRDIIGLANGTIIETAIGNGTEGGGISTCKQYVYDRSVYKSTTTSEWDLVCDKAWLRATGDSLFMVGVMLGSMIFGGLSDKYGRRPIFFLSLVIQLVGGILVAVAPEFISYVIFRLIVGSTTSGVFLVAYVIALEMVGPKKRLIAGVGCQLFFTTGYILTAGFAYFITDWRMLQVAITVPSIAFLLYWWFIPESARWLLTKGRLQEAKDLLQRASLENGVEMPSEALDTLLNNNSEDSMPDAKKPSLFDLFRYPNMRRKSILLFFNWLVNSGTYYGLSWHASNLGGNDYVNFVISGVVEVPAYTFLIFTLNRWGRKIILCGCMMLSGLALLGTLFVPANMPWLIVCLAMIGKLAITSSYGAIYVFTAEQFPTVIRNVGLGASSTFARIGGVIAPYVNHLSEIWMPLPLVIFGSSALFGGLMSLLLPETLNKKLPESIQDGELFGMKQKKKKKKQQLMLEQLNDVEIIKPLKAQEKQNGVHEKQNG
ncbi:PREDICTED: organic cation transporter protein-like [Wasmannia auropunctata]|uniref:organic cation transporter protein-like n=1 Tax=Wasmannia auropunctata TaxID=64793 RepID=UPI0005EE795F|nr:PREDICTED: organic cation transporter protein-like [Wasmannia auropunctata]XP_011689432.1 PREDICTED: organic cation transporter protein-like [Wasmannia auropunctata]XP_011689433.1 PREDICTED: organic cation transporter protein-like [Wasmannia auropunctata]XP_011689434.1 PREDICTED: organic cation transporter protein-like [Wasmannia auropunctata]XP_011689435.1 PREDICTED: organic cation transporter protein-like [Wasmannia auropunctata]XP_011689436.1 PREDICTED: organic cation transporter protein